MRSEAQIRIEDSFMKSKELEESLGFATLEERSDSQRFYPYKLLYTQVKANVTYPIRTCLSETR